MADKTPTLNSLSEQIGTLDSRKGLPPVDQWNPPFCGDLDMQIKRDGSWLYQGSPIQRKELVRLFSTILKREGDEYFLVTPVEKFRIQVEDVPFLAVAVEEQRVDGELVLVFETLTGDFVPADTDHPVRVLHNAATAEPTPYIRVRSNLEALIARNVFYRLVDNADVEEDGDHCRLYVHSAGQRFLLGSA